MGKARRDQPRLLAPYRSRHVRYSRLCAIGGIGSGKGTPSLGPLPLRTVLESRPFTRLKQTTNCTRAVIQARAGTREGDVVADGSTDAQAQGCCPRRSRPSLWVQGDADAVPLHSGEASGILGRSSPVHDLA